METPKTPIKQLVQFNDKTSAICLVALCEDGSLWKVNGVNHPELRFTRMAWFDLQNLKYHTEEQ